MFYSRSRVIFSKMSTEECKNLLLLRGRNFNILGKISEMKPTRDENIAMVNMMIVSSEGEAIDLGITIDEFQKWNKK